MALSYSSTVEDSPMTNLLPLGALLELEIILEFDPTKLSAILLFVSMIQLSIIAEFSTPS